MTPIPLQRSDLSTKILITVFLLFMVASFGIAFLNMYDKVGRLPHGAADRYGPDQDQKGGGYGDGIYNNAESNPNLALNSKINTFSALLDLTHPHMFETPIVLLVLCHFLMRTALASWAKISIYLVSFGSLAGILATPWLVRYVSLGFSSLLVVCAGLLACSSLVLVAVPLWEMWKPQEAEPLKVQSRVTGRESRKIKEITLRVSEIPHPEEAESEVGAGNKVRSNR
ncbi:MAG: hypothetical protein U0V70_06735 [Terriglobia bacterium]